MYIYTCIFCIFFKQLSIRIYVLYIFLVPQAPKLEYIYLVLQAPKGEYEGGLTHPKGVWVSSPNLGAQGNGFSCLAVQLVRVPAAGKKVFDKMLNNVRFCSKCTIMITFLLPHFLLYYTAHVTSQETQVILVAFIPFIH